MRTTGIRHILPMWAFCLLASLASTGCSPADSVKEAAVSQTGHGSQPGIETPGCLTGDEEPETIRFAITPFVGRQIISAHFEPILAYLARQTGRKFTLVNVSDYDEMLQLIAAGEVDFASLSPVLYVKAREQIPCLTLLLTQVARGSPYYSGYLLVNDSSAISSLNELAGKRLSLGPALSASGYVYPLSFLRSRGIEPASYFDEVVMAQDHVSSLRWLQEGRVDVAATFSSFRNPALASGLDAGKMRVLAVTGQIPYDAICARPGLSKRLMEDVRKALSRLNTTTPEGGRILGDKLDMGGWIPTLDVFYDPVRKHLSNLSSEEQP